MRDGHIDFKCRFEAGIGSLLTKLAIISAPNELVLNPLEPCPAVIYKFGQKQLSGILNSAFAFRLR